MITKVLIILGIGLFAADATAQETPVFKTPQDKASYGIGVNVARSLKREGIEVNSDTLIKGLKDGFAGERLLISEQELRQIVIEMQNTQMRKERMLGRTAPQINQKQGAAFLANNQTRAGVEVLPNGIQYKILKSGAGKKPAESNTVECFFRGSRIDGVEFISSNPGQPATFKVSDPPVIGWRTVLPLMTEGSKWQVFLPPQFAYGERGVGRDVGSNETIIFEIELAAVR